MSTFIIIRLNTGYHFHCNNMKDALFYSYKHRKHVISMTKFIKHYDVRSIADFINAAQNNTVKYDYMIHYYRINEDGAFTACTNSLQILTQETRPYVIKCITYEKSYIPYNMLQAWKHFDETEA